MKIIGANLLIVVHVMQVMQVMQVVQVVQVVQVEQVEQVEQGLPPAGVHRAGAVLFEKAACPCPVSVLQVLQRGRWSSSPWPAANGRWVQQAREQPVLLAAGAYQQPEQVLPAGTFRAVHGCRGALSVAAPLVEVSA